MIDPDSDEISVDGTITFCEDLDVNPEDVVLLAVAYELKSPSMGRWSRKGWVDGWRSLGCANILTSLEGFYCRFTNSITQHRADSIETMRDALTQLSSRLGSDSHYFQQVYAFSFDFSRGDGQRSLGLYLTNRMHVFTLITIPFSS